jgi:hypothetical protein
MNKKLKLWNSSASWEEAEKRWDEGSLEAGKTHPLKTLSTLPRMPGMTEETARNLKWKSIKYLLLNDPRRVFLRHFFKHPLKYTRNWVISALKTKPHRREGDFFLYGVESIERFQEELKRKDTLVVIGFSYCHKPFECPSGRFSDQCMHNPSHPVCRQCFIGKAVNALPEQGVVPLFIPTIHYIGERMFELTETHPDKQLLFIITACEMTLEMFGDWGNMIGALGIGVRLDGRICNTMRAFELSEQGIKPGLTVVLDPTQQKILELIRVLRDGPAETV